MKLTYDLWLLLAGLFLVSAGYNWLINWLHRAGRMQGYTWLSVIVGVGYTLAALAILDWQAALKALLLFAASGAPMALGDICRFWRDQEESRAIVRKLHKSLMSNSGDSNGETAG